MPVWPSAGERYDVTSGGSVGCDGVQPVIRITESPIGAKIFIIQQPENRLVTVPAWLGQRNTNPSLEGSQF